MIRKYSGKSRGYVSRFVGGILMLSFFSIGCATTVDRAAIKKEDKQVMRAKFTSSPVIVDGVLDDAVWQKAVAYLFVKYPFKKSGPEGTNRPVEGGEAKLAWDNENLYMAVKLMDSDIVAEGDKDQVYHFRMGDVAELFLKPRDKIWYWELYVTPGGRKTSFFIPGRGRGWLDKSISSYSCGLIVAATNSGTVNNWEDKDSYWTAEMAIPVKDLAARGDAFGPGSGWLILVARYNYSVYLITKELSTATPLPDSGGFDAYEGWAQLQFDK